MKIKLIKIRDKQVPVFVTKASNKAMPNLLARIEAKLIDGKNVIKRCLDTLISVEIVGNEAILHAYNENDTIALSLF